MILCSLFLLVSVSSVSSASYEQPPSIISIIENTLADAVSHSEEENDELFHQSVLSLASSMLTAFDHMRKVPELLKRRRSILTRLNRAESDLANSALELPKSMRECDTQIRLIKRAMDSFHEFVEQNEPRLTLYTEELITVLKIAIEVIAIKDLSKHDEIRDKLDSMIPLVDEVHKIGIILEASKTPVEPIMIGSSLSSGSLGILFPTPRGGGLLMKQVALERQYLLHVNFSKELKEVIEMEMVHRKSVLDDLMKSFPKDIVEKAPSKISAAAEDDDWIPQQMRPGRKNPK